MLIQIDYEFFFVLWKVDYLWICFVLCAVVTDVVPQLKRIANHGKFNIIDNNSDTFYSFHNMLQIPKSCFLHMYIISVAVSVYVWTTVPTRMNSHIKLCLLLWTIHGMRRLFESLFITKYGTSTMHIGGYLAGIVHYCAVPITILQGFPIEASSFSIPLDNILLATSLALFTSASYWQWKSHLVLFHMKQLQNSGTNSCYALPKEELFEYVCCPHYTAEIALYLSFCLMLPCTAAMWLLLMWVVMNLSVVANRQFEWYIEKYKEEVSPSWCRLLPGVW